MFSYITGVNCTTWKKFFAIPRDLWACLWWLGVGELWLLWACGGKDVWKVEEAQLEKGSEKNFTKSVLLRLRHFFSMTNVWSSQFYKKGVLTPGLFSCCHVGHLSWGKRPSGKNAVVSQSERSSTPSSSSLVMQSSVQMTDFGKLS